MSQRYHFAVTAVQTANLLDLAKFLSGAVNECLSEGQMPHMDPAVRLICYQIALSGNGDITFFAQYERIYSFCQAKMADGPNFSPLVVPELNPN